MGRRSAWLWALAGLAGLAGALILHLWTPSSGPEGSICFSRRVLDLPCPGCGLTRAFAHLAKGEWTAALAAHPLAPVLAVEFLLIWLAWGRAALRGFPFPRPAWVERAVLAHLAVLCALWVGRLSTGSLPW
ncbi:MAG TPA: DUF2752 domain-containing protein [Thermoanaerobaculia bacterium]|jgi:hypothetical protein|nr:DUF2752 domain-containing protein [Thermoanaerobaculia bacterium]